MEAMDKQIEAQSVGESFCKYFLQKASKGEGELHKFYKSDAVCSFGTDQPVTGVQQIKDKLQKLSGARFCVLPESGGRFMFQPTPNAGVLVMVSGLVWFFDAATKQHAAQPMRFVQTSLLVRGDQDSKFFISNDMHQFFDEKQSEAAAVAPQPVVAAAAAAGGSNLAGEQEAKSVAPVEPAVAVTAAAAPQKEAEEAKPEPAAAAAAAKPEPVAAAKPQRVRKEKPAAAAAAPVTTEPVEQEPAAEPLPKGPMSYSQIAKSAAAASPKPAAVATAAKPASTPKPVAAKPAAVSPAVAASSSSSATILVRYDEAAKVSPLLITNAFKPFGQTKAVHITSGGGVARVTFTTRQEAANILAHQGEPIKADGVELRVEAVPASNNNTQASSSRPNNNAATPKPSNATTPATAAPSSSRGRRSQKPSTTTTTTGSKPPAKQAGGSDRAAPAARTPPSNAAAVKNSA